MKLTVTQFYSLFPASYLQLRGDGESWSAVLDHFYQAEKPSLEEALGAVAQVKLKDLRASIAGRTAANTADSRTLEFAVSKLTEMGIAQ